MPHVERFTLDLKAVNEVTLTVGATPLCCNVVDGKVRMWALVQAGAPPRPYVFQFFATGQDLQRVPGGQHYLGTIHAYEGGLSYHLFWHTP